MKMTTLKILMRSKQPSREVPTNGLTDRIEVVCRKQNILKSNNCSVLKGTSTHCPISVVKNIMEDAQQSVDKQLWIVLQDICKAYDTVGWEALEKALNRIKMNK